MLHFEKVDKGDLSALRPFFGVQNTHLADFSLGFQFMWHEHLALEYAVHGNCLILRELFAGKYYFYYPLSLSGSREEEGAAIAAIETYCRDEDIRLHFTNVPRRAVTELVLRYGDASVTDVRRWRDYLYRAEDFLTYPGGKYAGQRNHVHKFTKLYPDWRFRPYTGEDEPAVLSFMKEYEAVQRHKNAFLANEELDEVYDILPHIQALGLPAGLLEAEGKLVGFTVGERCGDMAVIHIEKALRSYEGVYPMLAQQGAKLFCTEGVRYINRMDDAGDLGLRKSKLQYGPCELVDKYNVIPHRVIDGVTRLPTLETERLILSPVPSGDEDYFRLASDVERNRYWGYDWRDDHEGTPDAVYFTDLAQEDFAHRREMPLGIYAEGRLVGEVVLHRFGYQGEAEIGVRLLPEAEGKGYAREAVRAYGGYAMTIGVERLEAKCFRENTRSRAMLEGAGMRFCNEDDTYFYFYRTPEM